MLLAKDLCLSFGTRALFDHISLSVQPGQKIGLVGRNGAGKSTLIKVISGTQGLDSGIIELEKGKKLAYMPQEVVLLSEKSILEEAFSVFDSVQKAQAELAELEEYFHDPATDKSDEHKLERYAELQEELACVDAGMMLVDTKKVLQGLGLGPDRWDKPVNQLSVGWKMRLVLAKLLLTKADLYLFDEPTNHLDIVAKDWFVEFLKSATFSFLLVSHDRFFLDHVCDFIFALDRGKGKMYRGNYSQYLAQKERDKELVEKAYVEQQKEIKQKTMIIAKFRASASRAAQAQSMMKQLDKIERVEIEPKTPTLRLKFSSVQRPGKIVLNAENLSKTFGDHTIFKNATFEVNRDDKVALVAANGVGKTTLLNVLMGKYPVETGSFEFGHNVTTAFFEQDQERSLDHDKTILEEVEASCKTSEASQQARALLGAFMFPGDDVKKKISVLSGGEKNRVAMVKVFLANANVLILDEPTNHLDLESKEILLKALQSYPGTIIFVSHDRAFLDDLSTRILELTPNGVRGYIGNYESYLYQKNLIENPDRVGTAVSATPGLGSIANQPAHVIAQKEKAAIKPVSHTPKLTGREAYEMKKKISSLEGKIKRYEQELATLNSGFEALDFGSTAYLETQARIKKLQQQLQEASTEWELLQDKI